MYVNNNKALLMYIFVFPPQNKLFLHEFVFLKQNSYKQDMYIHVLTTSQFCLTYSLRAGCMSESQLNIPFSTDTTESKKIRKPIISICNITKENFSLRRNKKFSHLILVHAEQHQDPNPHVLKMLKFFQWKHQPAKTMDTMYISYISNQILLNQQACFLTSKLQATKTISNIVLLLFLPYQNNYLVHPPVFLK